MNASKLCLTLFLVAGLTLSPVLGSLAQADAISYKEISKLTSEDEYNIQQPKGLMLKFSFGGPKNYKQKKSVQDMQKANLDPEKKEAYFVLGIAIGMTILTLTEL